MAGISLRRKSHEKLSPESPAAQRPLQADIIHKMTKDEAKKARKGDVQALQLFRYNYHTSRQSANPAKKNMHCDSDLLELEQELRELVQEEIYVREELENPTKATQERLRIMNERYWFLKQKWCYTRSSVRFGYLGRGFDLWRSHPRWYMHYVLVEDCATRGGCCARVCNCCVDRKIPDTRQLGVGHCTLECGCCRRDRGFEISDSDKEQLKTNFICDRESTHWLLVKKASMWGLDDSGKNPFDLIDAPPSYGQVSNEARLVGEGKTFH